MIDALTEFVCFIDSTKKCHIATLQATTNKNEPIRKAVPVYNNFFFKKQQFNNNILRKVDDLEN
jgi:hypothetical protein